MDILGQVSEVYRKIRNTMRFLLANVEDFNAKEDMISYENRRSVDKYLTVRLNQVIKDMRTAYENYAFSTAYKTLVNFLTVDLSSFYLDFAKDVVYIDAKDDHARRCMQSVFYETLVALTKLMTPILPHTAEEIWGHLQESEEYVQLSEMPGFENFSGEEELLDIWKNFMTFRDDVLKALEEARNEKLIGKSLEAKVTIYPNEEIKALLKAVDSDFAQILIVSGFEVSADEAPAEAMTFENEKIVVSKAPGEVCPRCRAVKEDVGSHKELPELCDRCATIVEKEFPEVLETGFEN